MATTVPGIVLREEKGAELSYVEVDTNFRNLRNAINTLNARFDAVFTSAGALQAGAISNVNMFSSAVLVQILDAIIPLGTIFPASGTDAPSAKWLPADGSLVLRTTYADYYALVGDTYGAGDGVNTFNLPDTRGRALIGQGQGASLTLRNIGANGGEETHLLVIDETPTHGHTITDLQARTTAGTNADCLNSPKPGQETTPGTFPDLETTEVGGDQPHNNMPPFLTTAFFVKVLE